MLANCFFGAVKLTKNANPDKDSYSGYETGFYAGSDFYWPDGSKAKNVIVCVAEMSSSAHIGQKNKNVLVFGEGPTQELHDSMITTEAKYPNNFTQSGKRFVLSLHYIGRNILLFVNTEKHYQFKAKDPTYPLGIINISKGFLMKNMKKTSGFKGAVTDF